LEKIDEVPDSQRTEDMRKLVEAHGVEVHKEVKRDEEGGVMVTRVSLKGRSRILVRAGRVPLLPPISLASIDVEPELLKSPAGLLLFINSLVLKTLEAGGYDIAHLVASNALHAGLAVTGTSAAAFKSLALSCTSRTIALAAGAVVHARKVNISGSWAEAQEMAKYAGIRLVGARDAGRSGRGASGESCCSRCLIAGSQRED
jgi:hypothetical protein